MKIRKGDRVVVLKGRSRGKTGEVLRVVPRKNVAFVQGVNIVKRAMKPTQMSPGGITEKEAPIHVSNLALIDPESDKPTRVGFVVGEDGEKRRQAKRSGVMI